MFATLLTQAPSKMLGFPITGIIIQGAFKMLSLWLYSATGCKLTTFIRETSHPVHLKVKRSLSPVVHYLCRDGLHNSWDRFRQKPFSPQVLFKEHTCSPFHIFTASDKRTQRPGWFLVSNTRFIFTRHMKYLCCSPLATTANEPFEGDGRGQTSGFQPQWTVIKSIQDEMPPRFTWHSVRVLSHGSSSFSNAVYENNILSCTLTSWVQPPSLQCRGGWKPHKTLTRWEVIGIGRGGCPHTEDWVSSPYLMSSGGDRKINLHGPKMIQ